ncbi:hypothetical protein BSKO_08086 [Bryopsis sp. KO-2023]|nr:hypothetical protein BSKO_08086 [Bryopsis sp. KO-2023]
METKFTRVFGLKLPICQPPMAGVSFARLSVAVAESGGLGFVAAGFLSPADALAEFRTARDSVADKADGAVGVGYLLFPLRRSVDEREGYRAVLREKPKVVWLAFDEPREASPKEFVEEIRKTCGGECKIIYQVNSVEGALTVADAGVDAIVAQGLEAGGHQSFQKDPKSVFTLVPTVRKALNTKFGSRKESPCLLAAGGIVDGQAMAAALALGADGVVMGTRLYASEEAGGTAEMKAELASKQNTSRTRVWDELNVQALWPEAYGARSLQNSLLDSEVDTSTEAAQAAYRSAKKNKDYENSPIFAGQGIDRVESSEMCVDAIMKDVMKDAVGVIKDLSGTLVLGVDT